jgi:excisionase family DNA binding protein
MTEPLAVPVSEAVRLSGIGRSSLYLKIRDGELPTIKMGRRTLVSVAALRTLLDAHTHIRTAA